MRKSEVTTGVGQTYELGIFSVFMMHENNEVERSEEAGFLLRSKIASVDDGGVAAGVAVLDSPYLVD